MLIFILPVPTAHAFTITNLGWGASVQLRPGDIDQDGSSLGSASEQVLDEGSLRANLVDFSQPIDVNLSGALAGGSLSTRINRTYAFIVRLSNSERNRCVRDVDLDIDLSIVSPVRDAFAATGAGGGMLRLSRFEPVYRGTWGGRCPSVLFYGYTMDLDVEDAIAAGTYEATAQISIDLPGPGGSSRTLQVPLEVQMPGMLLLYHHSSIDVNLDATALAGAMGASRACSGGFCVDLGNRNIGVTSLAAPIPVDVAADAPAVAPIQTITLRDAVAVRATGCSGDVYDTASYQIRSAIGGVLPGNGPIAGIQSAPCGMDLRSGDLSFDLDLGQLDAVTGTASATIQITVTGL